MNPHLPKWSVVVVCITATESKQNKNKTPVLVKSNEDPAFSPESDFTGTSLGVKSRFC